MKIRNRWTVAAVVAGVVVAGPAVALATSGDSLHIKAPKRATLHVNFKYSVTGKSTTLHDRWLAVFLNTATPCPATLKGELKTPFKGTKSAAPLKYTSFIFSGEVAPNSTGPHFICVYMYDKSSKKTVANASHKYVTHS